MKVITKKIEVYPYVELKVGAKNKAICDLIDFEIEVMDKESPYYQHALEMDRMKTPWFLGEVLFQREYKDLEETLKINEYDFLEDGSIYL